MKLLSIQPCQPHQDMQSEKLSKTGILGIHQSAPKWHSTLIMELQNNHTHGSDQHPTTLNKAYNMIINYQSTNNLQDQTITTMGSHTIPRMKPLHVERAMAVDMAGVMDMMMVKVTDRVMAQ